MYAIRHEVFVKEQKLFEEMDVDEKDDVGTLLVAQKRSDMGGLFFGLTRTFQNLAY